MIELVGDNERSKNQNLKEKTCGFPGCGEIFYGRGKSKYCDEHKKQKYRKILYKKDKKNELGEANINIPHNSSDALKIIRKCGLKSCSDNYEVTLIPNQNIYPKYCEKHRNKFKREYFLTKVDDEK